MSRDRDGYAGVFQIERVRDHDRERIRNTD